MNNTGKTANLYLELILDGALDEKLEAEIASFLKQHPEYLGQFAKARKFCDALKKGELEDSVDPELAWRSFSKKLSGKNGHKSLPIRQIFKYAAMLILPLLVGAGLLFGPKIINKRETFLLTSTENQAIQPGTFKAVLKLSTGNEIVLDSITGNIEEKDGTSITFDSEGVSYLPSGRQAVETYNEMEVPAGGEYYLTLSDGTRVWLNAKSSLRYPTQFKKSVRTVFLQGEAYFEIAKNELKPFDVVTDELTVRAVGTSFNVMAYKEERNIQTTLVEGRVQIISQNLDNETAFLVYPSYQANYERLSKNLTQQKVDTENIIAWKNGLFVFEDENIESIMRRLARWYSIDVEYVNVLTGNYHFTGSVRKYDNISTILDLIQMTTLLNFTIKENKVLISSTE